MDISIKDRILISIKSPIPTLYPFAPMSHILLPSINDARKRFGPSKCPKPVRQPSAEGSALECNGKELAFTHDGFYAWKHASPKR